MEFAEASKVASRAVAAQEAALVECQAASEEARQQRDTAATSALALKEAMAALDAAAVPVTSLFQRVEELAVEALRDAQSAALATAQHKATAETALHASVAADTAVDAALLAAPLR